MFTKEELKETWHILMAEGKKIRRKIFGANKEEQSTMEYQMLRNRLDTIDKAQEKIGKMYINHDNMQELFGDGDQG